MVRVDGQLARRPLVHTTDIPDTEIDPGKIIVTLFLADVFLINAVTFMYISSLVYHFNKFSFHVIIYRPVTPEGPAAFHVA